MKKPSWVEGCTKYTKYSLCTTQNKIGTKEYFSHFSHGSLTQSYMISTRVQVTGTLRTYSSNGIFGYNDSCSISTIC